MIAGINEILTENSALITLIGANKIYPMAVPEGTAAPYLSTSLARSGAENLKTGLSGIEYPLVNINVHCDNYDDLETVSEAVRDALDDINANTDAGFTFTRIWFFNAFDRPDLYDTTKNIYTRSVQFNAIVKR